MYCLVVYIIYFTVFGKKMVKIMFEIKTFYILAA